MARGGGQTALKFDDDPQSPLPCQARTASSGQSLTPPAKAGRRKTKLAVALLVFCFVLGSGLVLRWELNTSYFQSKVLHHFARRMTFELGTGPSPRVVFPAAGPYDLRYGYALLPRFIQRLSALNFGVAAQARVSEEFAEAAGKGIFPIYREKSQAGLKILDRHGSALLSFRTPDTVYADFQSIPSILVDTLLFIEDRNLLDEDQPRHNPAVEWDRFGKAVFDLLRSKVDRNGRHVAGGSTLATQMEKFRHCEEGITAKPTEKLRQMASAALRAYRDGENNIEARRSILLDYVNSVPLAAVPGYGEVNGLGDGLRAYYGRDLEEVNRLLRGPFNDENSALLARQAVAYWQVLSLFLAHRRPSEYLGLHPQVLTDQIAVYLPLLYRSGIIPLPLYEMANKAHSRIHRDQPQFHRASFTERKGLNVIRAHLLAALGLPSLYDLDRLDLTVRSSIDEVSQAEVTKILTALKNASYVRQAGLEGFRMLDGTGDPGKIIYSFTLWEKGENSNRLRVQTDNYDQPLDINEGAKLDLGSTAKLRTLITYLEVIEALHEEYSEVSPKVLRSVQQTGADPLSLWAVEYMLKAKDKRLRPMLEAAMERRYSASPAEAFFTGGGLHTFRNFKPEDDHRIVSIREAIRHSINLPFVRLMRDVVRYYSLATTGSTARALKSMDHMDRQEYLRRFADKEGQIFLGRFYLKYSGKSPEEILQILLEGVRRVPRRFAAVYYILNPGADRDQFGSFMRANLDDQDFSELELEKLYAMFSQKQYSLADQGYIARLHPLEVWVAGYLMKNPKATLAEATAAGAAARQEVYEWLFKTRHRHAQDKRIRMIMEAEAFTEIHREWQKLGYPLRSIVPSYATALGTSADRPDALAELMGIIVNGGKRMPMLRMESLEFAANTPFHTLLTPGASQGTQVLNPEIASLVRNTLIDIAENGTAIRLRGGFRAGGKHFAVGGKTGTGDHRYKIFGKGGWLKESRVVNRTATFMFIIGDRFFGTLTALVRGPEAGKFSFTSALPVQLLKILEPAIDPLLVLAAQEEEAEPEKASVSANGPSSAAVPSSSSGRVEKPAAVAAASPASASGKPKASSPSAGPAAAKARPSAAAAAKPSGSPQAGADKKTKMQAAAAPAPSGAKTAPSSAGGKASPEAVDETAGKPAASAKTAAPADNNAALEQPPPPANPGHAAVKKPVKSKAPSPELP